MSEVELVASVMVDADGRMQLVTNASADQLALASEYRDRVRASVDDREACNPLNCRRYVQNESGSEPLIAVDADGVERAIAYLAPGEQIATCANSSLDSGLCAELRIVNRQERLTRVARQVNGPDVKVPDGYRDRSDITTAYCHRRLPIER